MTVIPFPTPEIRATRNAFDLGTWLKQEDMSMSTEYDPSWQEIARFNGERCTELYLENKKMRREFAVRRALWHNACQSYEKEISELKQEIERIKRLGIRGRIMKFLRGCYGF
jgi:hypothetical protein